MTMANSIATLLKMTKAMVLFHNGSGVKTRNANAELSQLHH